MNFQLSLGNRDSGATSRFAQFFKDLNRELEEIFSKTKAGLPEITVRDSGSEYIVQGNLPGWNREDLEFEVRDDRLLIKGVHRETFQEEKNGRFRHEQHQNSFQRLIFFPENIRQDQTKTTYQNGKLELIFQKVKHNMND